MTTATGARRRLQALANRGWSATAIGGQGLGVSAAQAKRVMERGGPVTPELAERVAAAYDVLWNRPPPQRTGGQPPGPLSGTLTARDGRRRSAGMTRPWTTRARLRRRGGGAAGARRSPAPSWPRTPSLCAGTAAAAR